MPKNKLATMSAKAAAASLRKARKARQQPSVGTKLMTRIQGVATLVEVTAVKAAGEAVEWSSRSGACFQVRACFNHTPEHHWVRTTAQVWLPVSTDLQ